MPTEFKKDFTDQEALDFHQQGKPGKLEIIATKPVATQRDLSLAYSPGVAVPVRAIAEDPQKAYAYTAKGNIVAVISNGSAILGLGDLGALASKPVMEGKAVLFKRFADIDGIDLEVDTRDVDEFVNAVRYLGPSFGGINLEDIKSPDCFIIESRLRELMDIPVFHDDQHGTAIIAVAGLINALDLTGRDIRDVRMVCNGAGAAALSCMDLILSLGLRQENLIMFDKFGPIRHGRTPEIDEWQAKFATNMKAETLQEALEGADVLFGLSAAGVVSKEMVAAMAPKPIIFAMANPEPEIRPELVAEVRDDAIMATGRSDYPNQVNNVLGFPYIFRGALDVQAREINDAMKLAAARSIAELARADVPDKVAAAYSKTQIKYGPEYIIPAPFDPRLISYVPPAVAKAAMDTGVAQRTIVDMAAYTASLSARLDPVAGFLQKIQDDVRANPRRVVFAEGEQEQVIRAANTFMSEGFGKAVLIGRESPIHESFAQTGIRQTEAFEIHNAATDEQADEYAEFLYARMQRKGFLLRDCQRLVNTDRNIFAACMVAKGHADAMVTGVTRNWSTTYDYIRRVLDAKPGHSVIGMSLALCRGRTVFVADTSIHDMPDAVELADIAEEAAGVVKRLGFEPRVAMLAYSTFGYPRGERSDRVAEAVSILDSRSVDFEYDGEMAADVALNPDKMEQFPFCRLTDTANVLIMPAFHSASIATKMLQELGGTMVIGPLLCGMERPVQICSLNAQDTEIVNMAAFAAYDINA